jgi:hypothetical protein
MTNRIPLIVNAGDAQIQELGNSDNLIVAGNILAGGYYYANGQPFVPGGNASVLVTSNVTAVVAGQPLTFNVDYSNTQYTGGVFTLVQNVTPDVTITVSDTWSSGGTSKNQYTDFANSIVNTQGISLTISLVNSTFNVQSSDSITIGTSTVTGSNLLSLGIAGTGGTYTIPASSFSSDVQTANSSAVSVSLTTAAGVRTANGTTLTTVAPVPFNFVGISGSFANATVTPATANQSFSWSINGVVGTVLSGNAILSGSQSANLTTTGATSGTSAIYNSTIGPFNLLASYTGTGTNGSGTRTVTHTGSVTPATTVTPLYWKTTTSDSNPNFTTSDNSYPVSYAPNEGQGAQSTDVTTNWTWIAIPAAGPGPVPPQFKYDQPPFIGIVTTPDQTYNGINIGGATYNAYGFTNFSVSVFVYTAT